MRYQCGRRGAGYQPRGPGDECLGSAAHANPPRRSSPDADDHFLAHITHSPPQPHLTTHRASLPRLRIPAGAPDLVQEAESAYQSQSASANTRYSSASSFASHWTFGSSDPDPAASARSDKSDATTGFKLFQPELSHVGSMARTRRRAPSSLGFGSGSGSPSDAQLLALFALPGPIASPPRRNLPAALVFCKRATSSVPIILSEPNC